MAADSWLRSPPGLWLPKTSVAPWRFLPCPSCCGRGPGQIPCRGCIGLEAPVEFAVTFTGIVEGSCGSCSAFNDTFIVSYSRAAPDTCTCVWEYDVLAETGTGTGLLCDVRKIRFVFCGTFTQELIVLMLAVGGGTLAHWWHTISPYPCWGICVEHPSAIDCFGIDTFLSNSGQFPSFTCDRSSSTCRVQAIS